MPNIDADYLCPLYQRREKNVIVRCDGILPGSVNTLTRFRNVMELTGWIEKHCRTWGFKECPIYKAVEAQYDEKDDG